MAIGSAIVKNKYVVVYDEKGKTLFERYLGDGILQGFTNSSVSIIKDKYLKVYDEKNREIHQKYVG